MLLRLVPPPETTWAKVEQTAPEPERVRVTYGHDWRRYADRAPEGFMAFGTITLPGDKPAALFMSARGNGLDNKTLHAERDGAEVELSDSNRTWAHREAEREVNHAWHRMRKSRGSKRINALRQQANKTLRTVPDEAVQTDIFVYVTDNNRTLAFDQGKLIKLIGLMNRKTLLLSLQHLGPFAANDDRAIAAIEDRIKEQTQCR